MYEFVDDSFFSGTYMRSEGYQNKNNFIDDYKQVGKTKP